MNTDNLISKITEQTCTEHFYYDSNGNGVTTLRQFCPMCKIIRLTARADMLKKALEQIVGQMPSIDDTPNTQSRMWAIDRIAKEALASTADAMRLGLPGQAHHG